jgi:hypothetical protein
MKFAKVSLRGSVLFHKANKIYENPKKVSTFQPFAASSKRLSPSDKTESEELFLFYGTYIFVRLI